VKDIFKFIDAIRTWWIANLDPLHNCTVQLSWNPHTSFPALDSLCYFHFYIFKIFFLLWFQELTFMIFKCPILCVKKKCPVLYGTDKIKLRHLWVEFVTTKLLKKKRWHFTQQNITSHFEGCHFTPTRLFNT
jgi:hypothetical protein